MSSVSYQGLNRTVEKIFKSLEGLQTRAYAVRHPIGGYSYGTGEVTQTTEDIEHLQIFMLQHDFDHGMPDKVKVIMKPIIDLSEFATIRVDINGDFTYPHEYKIHNWKHHTRLIIEAELVRVDGAPDVI